MLDSLVLVAMGMMTAKIIYGRAQGSGLGRRRPRASAAGQPNAAWLHAMAGGCSVAPAAAAARTWRASTAQKAFKEVLNICLWWAAHLEGLGGAQRAQGQLGGFEPAGAKQTLCSFAVPSGAHLLAHTPSMLQQPAPCLPARRLAHTGCRCHIADVGGAFAGAPQLGRKAALQKHNESAGAREEQRGATEKQG